jgi:uncharacterized membrane protein
MTRLRAFWESMRATYWVVPSIMAVGACGLSFAMTQLDQAATADLLDRWSWVYTGGPEGARGVLSTIAASMIGVAGVTFSITIVVLTLASQQFGPRLLRNFLRDLGNQVVLGTFISTFLYCLLVLRTVRGNDSSEFVPHLAVTVGVVLAMFSLGVLIFFIHHVATSIQASQIIANVSADLDGAIRRLFPERIGAAAPAADTDRGTGLPPIPDREPAVVASTASGYVQAVDGERLMALAREHDLLVRVDAPPGTFVREGRALLRMWPNGGGAPPPGDGFLEVFILGAERTGTQDLAFFVEQLVELAVRALSPGINDPGTARACIDRLEQALCHLAARQMPSACRMDRDGVPRLMAEPATFAGIADLAFGEIGRHGRSSVSVTCHLLGAIRGIAPCIEREADHSALMRHASAIWSRGHEANTDEVDRALVDESYRQTMAALRVPAD